MEQNLIPNYKIEGDDSTVIFDTSYVANPATQKGFLKFSEDGVKQVNSKFSMLGEWERMTSGVWFMPDTKYLRVDEQGNYYTVEITKESLKKALTNFLKRGYGNNTSLEHTEYMSDDKFVAVEYWIIDSVETLSPIYKLSLTDLGYNPDEIPVGTVMKTTYVADESFWNEQVLSGNVTGYSIEGLFSLRLDAMESFNETVHEKVSEEVKEKAQEIVNGELTIDDTTYVVQEGYVVDSTEFSEVSIEISDEDPKEEQEDVKEDIEDTTNDDENIQESEPKQERDLAKELDDLKELISQLQNDKMAQQSELESKEKQLEAMRKELNNQPIKSNFTATNSVQKNKEFKIGGQTFYINN